MATPPSNQYKLNPETSLEVLTSGSLNAKSSSLIFLHFWGGSARTYTPLTTILSSPPQNYHCICISFRGWGSSIGPSEIDSSSTQPRPYSIAQLANDIETLIPKLETSEAGYILIGHSMGGKVAQLLAGRANNQNTDLKGLMLCAPAPPSALVLPKEMQAQQLSAYTSPEAAQFVVRNVLTSPTSNLSSSTIERVVQDMLCGNESAKKAWPEYAMGEDIVEEARKIDVPTLVLVGSEDRVETVERVKSQTLPLIQEARLGVIEGAGHLLMLEKTEEVALLVEDFVGRIREGI